MTEHDKPHVSHLYRCTKCGITDVEQRRCCTQCGSWDTMLRVCQPCQSAATKVGEHAELISEARGLANRLDCDETQRLPGLPHKSVMWLRVLSPTLRTLADTVEEQDKVIAELVAACATCDEVIGTFLVSAGLARGDEEALEVLRRGSVTLDTARRQAERAAKLPEPKGEVDEEPETGTCMRCGKTYEYTECWLGPYCSTDCAQTPAEKAAYEERMEGLQRDAKAAKAKGDTTAQPPRYTGPPLPLGVTGMPDKTDVAAEPAPPVAVEMRCVGGGSDWRWQCCLMGIWIAPGCYADDECEPVVYPTKLSAQGNGGRWLAALSEQLGVPLVAVWTEGA